MLRFVLYISMLVAVACSTYACVHLVINEFSSDRYDYCLWCPTSNTSLNASLHHFSSTHQSHFVIGSSLALRNISSRRLSDKTNHDFVTVGGFGLGYVETFNLLEERIRPSQTYIIPFQPYLTGDSTKTDHLEYHKFQHATCATYGRTRNYDRDHETGWGRSNGMISAMPITPVMPPSSCPNPDRMTSGNGTTHLYATLSEALIQ